MTASHARPAAPGRYRNDLVLFMAIAFALSWASWAVAIGIGGSSTKPPTLAFHVFGAFGPLIAALVIRIRRARRGEPVPEHAVRFRPAALGWTPLLLALASALVLGAAFVAHAAGGPAPSLEDAKDVMTTYPGGPVAFLVNILVAGPLAEEPGWRGTAYPRMRASLNRFQVSLILGVIWAVWHMPLFFIDGTVQNQLGVTSPSGVLFAVSAVPMAMLVCYAYERAGVLAAVAVHFATNLTMVLLSVQAPVTQAIVMGVQLIAAVVLLATVRPAGRPVADGPSLPAIPANRGAHVR
ncbi:CPBP family intramembrane glutamic endopeptidase [Actinomadura rugatobispora]|uniref:CPBP family intramembrane glutamic endopeptidase n=1 Tax=Actinomadura rugatobispora TaxID=1994 RepID=A0ABW1AEF1_9ACTN|nr:CPBP family intramembrane metalloprotease [Actinomadura rugatobispora]